MNNVLLAILTALYIIHGVRYISGNNYDDCPNGGMIYSDSYNTICYWIIQSTQTAERGERKCALDGGHLAIVPFESVSNTLYTFISGSNVGSGWLFLGYTEKNKMITIIHTGEPQMWAHWDNNEPNDNKGTSETCVAVRTGNGKWHDIPCGWTKNALCFKPLIPDTTTEEQTTTTTTTQIPTTPTSTTTTEKPSTSSTTTTEKPSTTSTTTTEKPSTSSTTTTEKPSTPSPTTTEKPSTTSTTTSEQPSTSSTTTTEKPSTSSTTTTEKPSTTSTTTTEKPTTTSRSIDCFCPCQSESIESRVKKLKIDKETLSSTIRKRISVSDPRPSAAYVGYIGVGFMTMVFGGIILVDLLRTLMG